MPNYNKSMKSLKNMFAKARKWKVDARFFITLLNKLTIAVVNIVVNCELQIQSIERTVLPRIYISLLSQEVECSTFLWTSCCNIKISKLKSFHWKR